VELPLLKPKPTVLGISGHWAEEELDYDQYGNNREFDSWSLNLDLSQPVNEWLTLQAELFIGENLGAYPGGIGQGISTVTFKDIGSKGGWMAANLRPAKQ
jgi:hypothetical protein